MTEHLRAHLEDLSVDHEQYGDILEAVRADLSAALQRVEIEREEVRAWGLIVEGVEQLLPWRTP